MTKKSNSITEGSIIRTITVFSLPLLGGSLIQQLYNTADMIFVGNFINKHAAAAVGSSGLVFTCIIGLLTGISVGVGVIVSQKTGSGDTKIVNTTVHTSIVFGVISGFILTVAGLIFSKKLLILMNTPDEIMPESLLYLKIYFLSMCPMILYNIGSGIIRSSGDSRTPFYILVIGGVCNVIFNALLIIFLNMGVKGVAIATFISQNVTSVLTVWFLIKGQFLKISSLKLFYLNFSLLKKILYYGLPAGVQSMIITFSNIAVQYYINGYGGDAVAAYSTYFKLENLIWLPIVSIGQAITIFTGQNKGAGNYDRIKKGTLASVLLSSGITILIAFIILLFPTSFLRIFINDKKVVELGKKIIFTTFPFYWLYSILETFGGSIRGMGYSLTSMGIIISTLCLSRVFFLMVITNLGYGFQSIALVYPVTWAFAAFLFMFFFIKYMRKTS